MLPLGIGFWGLGFRGVERNASTTTVADPIMSDGALQRFAQLDIIYLLQVSDFCFITIQMEKKNRSRVFIVDDHPVVRDGLKNLIEQEEDLVVCGEAPDAATALKT